MPVGFSLLGNSSNTLCGALLLPFAHAQSLAHAQSFEYVPFYNNPPASLDTSIHPFAFIPDVYGALPTKMLDSISENGTIVNNRVITNMTLYLARNTVNDSAFVFVNIFDDNKNFASNVGNIVYNDLPANGTFGVYQFDSLSINVTSGYSVGLTFIPNESDYAVAGDFNQTEEAYVITASGDNDNDVYPTSSIIIFNETEIDSEPTFKYDSGPDLGMILYDLEPVPETTPVCTIAFSTYIQIVGVFMSIIVIILLLLILKYVRANR